MKMKRVLSLLLALVMTFSLLTLPSYAEDEDTAEEVTHVEDAASEDDFSALTVAEQYAALMAMEDEAAIEAAIAKLTEEQQNELESYAMEQAIANYVAPETVVFTDAGPFMPAVNVASARKLMKSASAPKMLLGAPTLPDAKGLEFTKTAKDNGDGTYTITMEAYTTGSVSTETSTMPVDIVLVLDQSASMSYNFNGESTSDNTARRQYAMKQAVNRFIEEVGKKYDAEKSDHRMALVTFGDGATTLKGWTPVDGYVEGKADTKGVKSLKDAINSLPDSWTNVGTPTDEGMAQANKLINGSDYKYTGNNTVRQKVVILFTDGMPGSGDFDIDVANKAIKSAKAMKDAGVTVFSVGVFNGANPNELYGASGFDTNSNGTEGSKWENQAVGFLIGRDFPEADRPAGNRFLNYISSNFEDAENIGLDRDSQHIWIFITYDRVTYTIKKNVDRTASNYYLTAANAASLNNLFTEISQRIDTRDIDLGSKTVVRDTVSDYFKAPANANAVTVKTVNCTGFDSNGKPLFAQSGTTLTGKTTVENGVVSVTGFDFNENFVAKNPDGTPHGKKLIIEFTVSPKDGFLGGNNVPTNGEASVVDEKNTVVEGQPSPEVNVPLANLPNLTANDKNIYLLGTAPTAAELGTIVKPTGADAWKADFVDFSAITADKTVSNTEDTTVNLSVTISPKYTGTDAIGTVQNAVEKKATAKVNVFKPEVEFKDSTIYQGATPNYANDNYVSVVWKHGNDTAPDTMGKAPELTYTYGPAAAAFTDCTPVAVSSVKLNGTTLENFKNHVKFLNGNSVTTDKQFTVHVLQPTITATVNDVQKYYGEDYTLGAGANGFINVDWKDAHDDSNIPNAIGTKPYEANDLSLAYETTAFSGQTGTVPNKDFDVTVKVMKGTQEMTDATITTSCTYGCGADQTDGKYTVHVKTCTITINKDIGEGGLDENQSFLFNVRGSSRNEVYIDPMSVTIQGRGSVTITGLPIGDYSVYEDGNWSWRYLVEKNISGFIFTMDKMNGYSHTVTFTNNRDKTQWLSGENFAINAKGEVTAHGTFVSGN